jgi:hypothetical protein
MRRTYHHSADKASYKKTREGDEHELGMFAPHSQRRKLADEAVLHAITS